MAGKLIYQAALYPDEEGNLQSYWPERFSVEELINTARVIGSLNFAVSYQNDPSGLGGNFLKYDWLHYYLPEDLADARKRHGVERGWLSAGIDPTFGGEGSDPDFMSIFVIEVCGNEGFAVAHLNVRMGVQSQGARIHSFLAPLRPSRVQLEEVAKNGYVYNDLKNHVRSNLPIQVVRPETNMKGNKQVRFMQMAPRFETAQVRIPGRMDGGNLVAHHDWLDFVTAWTAFPAGHDDLLDAAYWAIHGAFQDIAPGFVSIYSGKTAPQLTSAGKQAEDDKGRKIEIAVDERGRPLRSIGEGHRRSSIRMNLRGLF
jgi:phage terminase large subunit-like protein